MSKKRPTESSWDSDEELLNDSSGNAITAFPKTAELDLLGDDDELDEDALLGVDEIGVETTTISFTNDSLWPITTSRQRSKNTSSHQEHPGHETHVDEQAFVFEETDTADLEDELNVGGHEEDVSSYRAGGRSDYSRNLYHQGVSGKVGKKIHTREDLHVDYSDSGMNASDGGEIGYLSHAEQAAYGDDNGAEFGAAAASGDYIGDAGHEDVSGVELEYEQQLEQEEQVHLEYEDSRTVDHDSSHQSEEAKNTTYESESDSDNEDSRHSRGKFTSERTGVISLTASNTREAIPDTLEINDEQAAQIEQFMSDKTQRVKGKGKNRGRPSAHSRLGAHSGAGPKQNPKGPPQVSRKALFSQGMSNQKMPLGFPFQGGPQNRAPFPLGLMNQRGPFPSRLLNQRGIFSRAQNQRQLFPLGPGSQRGQFPVGPLNLLLGSALLRGPFSPERFTGGPNPRGHFTRGPQALGPRRMLRQNSLNSPRGPQHPRGPPPNQLRPQGSFIQRGVHPQQFGQMGQPGNRPPGPRNAGPRPPMGQHEPGIKFVRNQNLSGQRPTINQQCFSFPPPVKPLLKPPQGNQMRPGQEHSLIPPDSRQGPLHERLGPPEGQIPPNGPRAPPHQRLGPPHGQIPSDSLRAPAQQRLGPAPIQNRHNSPGQFQRPKFTPRGPVSGGPLMNVPVFQGNQQPLMGAQGDASAVRKHKIYINPRFQGQKEGDGASRGFGRTVKMGAPIQQKKAKLLLDKAIQNQNKQAPTEPATSTQATPPAGIKRKSTGDEGTPAKIMKSDVSTGEVSSTRVVQANSEPSAEESKKINVLLEQQKKQRELIQKRKEIARQKQAAIKRKELELRLKEEGKTISELLGSGATKIEDTAEQKPDVPPVKQISGSVAARLGPPPSSQQQIKDPPQQTQYLGPTPAKIRPPLSHGASGPVSSQEFSPATKQPQNSEARTAAQTSTVSVPTKRVGSAPIARIRGPASSSDTRFRGPASSGDTRFRGPAPSSILRLKGPQPRYQTPPPTSQLGTSQPQFGKSYSATQNTSFSISLHNTDPRLRAPSIPDLTSPPPMTQSALKAASHQTSIQPNATLGQTIRYTEPPPSIPQTARFQAPYSAQSHVPAQMPTSQPYHSQYTPSTISYSHPPNYYSQPSQSDTSVYSSTPQYTPQVTSYQHTAYATPVDQQYQPHTQYPPPSQSYSQSQYQLQPQQQYQSTEATQYQTQVVSLLYQQPPPAQPQYQVPVAQPQYHVPPVQTQYQTPPPQYQAVSTQPYQSSTQTYSTPSDQHYQHISYYTEQQPIETVTNQASTATSAIEDQRTVQHQVPVGQRIQTIGQRVQPASVAHMRSIIHNVVSQPSHTTEAPQSRHVQSQPATSKVATDGQAKVLDGPQKILIQNVPSMATKETLIKICRHFGQVLGVNLMSEQNKAVVQFQKGEQAAKCVAKCNQKCLHKTRLTVKLLPN